MQPIEDVEMWRLEVLTLPLYSERSQKLLSVKQSCKLEFA